MLIVNVKKETNNLVAYTYRKSQQQFIIFVDSVWRFDQCTRKLFSIEDDKKNDEVDFFKN
jgi:hypothetical protein